MAGPVAPKDPEKRRAYFYIIKNKEAFGALDQYGRPIQYIHEDAGRLINSAQIVGKVEDPEILTLLEDTAGFRKLIHSIGISATMDQPMEKLTFTFQMYGKQDRLGGGTKLVQELTADGMERRIVLDEIEWSEDDKEPGQILFEFEHPLQMASVSVKFYLNDGYAAPDQEEESAVDTSSDVYRRMIARSLMQLGDTERLKQVIQKARNKEEVTLSYIGGSITQGAGAAPVNTECYAYLSYKGFMEKYDTEQVDFVKAGVGGTPSELGMLRFERDVLRDGSKTPDVVVIEFAVNDEGDETHGVCYESLVRKALKLPNHPAVILLFSVFANDWNLQDRLRCVGETYNLPMVSVLDAVSPQFLGQQEKVISKNQFFYDMFHPSNLGHKIMADCLLNLLDQTEKSDGNIEESKRTPVDVDHVIPAIGADFTEVHLLDKKDTYELASIDAGTFAYTDCELQSVEMDDTLELTPEFPHNYMYDGTKQRGGAFTMNITSRALLIIFKDSGEVDSACANVYVDDELVYVCDPHVNGWLHCNPKILYCEKESREHRIKVEVCREDLDKKFTILGFGYVK